jgi:hypothetical protein
MCIPGGPRPRPPTWAASGSDGRDRVDRGTHVAGRPGRPLVGAARGHPRSTASLAHAPAATSLHACVCVSAGSLADDPLLRPSSSSYKTCAPPPRGQTHTTPAHHIHLILLLPQRPSCCNRRRRSIYSTLQSTVHWDMETVVGDLMATELRLGLPGTVDDCSQHQQQTQLKVAAPPSNPTRGKKRPAAEEEEANKRDAEAAPPAAK